MTDTQDNYVIDERIVNLFARLKLAFEPANENRYTCCQFSRHCSKLETREQMQGCSELIAVEITCYLCAHDG